MFKFFKDINNHNFLHLWVAQLISQFGDRINQMALIGLAYELSGSKPTAMGLAKLLAFSIIPVFFVGPIAGVFVDRWDRRKTLFICDIARGLLVITIPFVFFFWKTMIPIYAVVFLSFCFSRFYVPAKMSIIPQLVSAENLLAANSMMTTTGMVAFVLGCALGGFLVEWFGARGGFIIDATTFFISATLILTIAKDFRLNINPKSFIERERELMDIEWSFWRELKEGVVYLFTKKEIRFVINIFFVLLAAAGGVYVVIIVFIQQTFNSITRHLGVLAVTLGAGLFLGSILYGRFGKRFTWYKTIFFCMSLSGVAMMLFVVGTMRWPNVWLAFITTLLLGITLGPIFIAANTVVHKVADEKMQGKVFSSLEVVIHLAFLVSMFISSWLSEIINPAAILMFVSAVCLFIGVVGFFRYKYT